MSRRPPVQVSRWDRFLLGMFPRWGLRRLHARAAATSIRQHYEAAAAGRTDGWRRTGGDANSATPDLPALRDLSRDLIRNNGWARRGVNVIARNTVGWGLKPKATGADKTTLKLADETWNAWSNSVLCDYDGRLTFPGLQKLVMRTIVPTGAALVVRTLADPDDDLEIPIRVRVLESDYIDTSKDGPVGGPGSNVIVQGIELDRRGRRVAYWLHRRHPGATGSASLLGTTGFDSIRVPEEDVLHVYDVERAGALHGIPWLCAAIAKLGDLDDYEDARLIQMKVASAFGVFVEDLDVGFTSPIGGLLAGGIEPPPPSATGLEIEWLEPGKIQYLPAGKKISFPQMPATTDHASFSAANLRRIAAALDVTYEDLTGDYSQVNYSSARMGRLSHQQAVEDWRWNMLAPQLCDGVWRWVMEFAAEVDGWPVVPRADWSAPPLPMLDPEKEGRATSALVRSGQKTLFQVWREQGEDPELQLADIAKANKRLDELGIVLDSDPRRVNAAGGAQLGGALETTLEEDPTNQLEPPAVEPTDDEEADLVE